MAPGQWAAGQGKPSQLPSRKEVVLPTCGTCHATCAALCGTAMLLTMRKGKKKTRTRSAMRDAKMRRAAALDSQASRAEAVFG